MVMSTLYSFSIRYWKTSNCRLPTTPTMISSMPAPISWKIWMAPSWAIWVAPLTNCLRFIVSFWRTRLNSSGAKVGMPSKVIFFPGAHSVSPMENTPGSNTPMMSPA